MNLITQQQTSIVDPTPGTTADSKASMMEIHGLGPCKIIDTPGADESGVLGDKKREKVFQSLKESNVALLVVEPGNPGSEKTALSLLSSLPADCKPLILYNVKAGTESAAVQKIDEFEQKIADPTKGPIPSLTLNFLSRDTTVLHRILKFICVHVKPYSAPVSLLPPGITFDENSSVLLNIPMDAETPGARLLKPQSMLLEALLRDYISAVAFRMNLISARAPETSETYEKERRRFRRLIEHLGTDQNLKLIVTDSQAIKEVSLFTKDLGVPITTFSVMMANYMSGGRLPLFIEGIRAFEKLEPQSKILICEACNHDRIVDDIGTVQIPKALKKKFGEDGISLDFAFGREYQTKNLGDYSLILHCGGCMLNQQQMNARLSDMEAVGVPITNYGLLLSYLASPGVLNRVLEPWKLDFRN
jgi:[FeFe] hydrogenase H-cluster maturation GTPase HydF